MIHAAGLLAPRDTATTESPRERLLHHVRLTEVIEPEDAGQRAMIRPLRDEQVLDCIGHMSARSGLILRGLRRRVWHLLQRVLVTL
jgi:hypothetical protein